MDYQHEFHGPNIGYVLELYEQYRHDPDSVGASARRFFDQWEPGVDRRLQIASEVDLERAVGAANLAQAIRARGYLKVQLDPLGSPPQGDPALSLDFHGLNAEDLNQLPSSLVGGSVVGATENAQEAIHRLRQIYCSSIGYDYGHVHIPEERKWLREAAESGRFRPPETPIEEIDLLKRLTEVEVFEHFLHRIFPGKTRFSIEGLDMMVPMLDEIVDSAVKSEICMIFISMAHRGRLNVLAHVLGKPYEEILAEFKDPRGRVTTWDEIGWTGDVKYHLGGRKPETEEDVVDLVICMPSNPSHLEHVNPVVQGMARAANTSVDNPGDPQFYPKASLPILIHGDAAFTGQGVVAETLNLSRLPGYNTAGSIHIIANNQLGFTATEKEMRSSLHASDLGKGFEIPIIHVNADKPLACIEAARTAFAYRLKFQKDFLINLVGYRRYGHNEGDEPAFTQPVMYSKIRQHPTVRDQWADELITRERVDAEFVEGLVRDRMAGFQDINESLEPEEALREPYPEPPPPGAAQKVETAVPLGELRELNKSLLEIPEGFNLNRKIGRSMKRRQPLFDDPDEDSIDWATAEELAFATILQDGTAIRLTGEDVARGTFSQRHSVFYDVETNDPYTPLKSIPQAQAAFEVHNTPLTENATVGFEFGYNISTPDRLVIWEAQYGDFVNIAQIMIDEFLVSSRAKWGQTPSLVLLLPHGNEGQGPDHSSARPERFLSLAAETNMRIAYPTSACQYFHLLRRQAALLKTDPLPLITFTPKGLLRHPKVASRPRDFAEGRWEAVLDDPCSKEIGEQVQQLILCSGRIYIDLVNSELRKENAEVAIIRLEQLFPIPKGSLASVLEKYPNIEQVVWIQEEPQNMGAWNFLRTTLRELISGRYPLQYLGRPASSSPAEGSTTLYQQNQKALVEKAYNLSRQVDTIRLITESE